MASRIKISNHAVERYRERTIEDSLRKERTSKKIREMIEAAIIADDKWEHLKEQMKDGQKKEYQLNIRVFDDWDFIATHKAVLTPSRKGKSYTVVTFV
jgi:hypothetical protein